MSTANLTQVDNYNYGIEKIFEKAQAFLPINGTDYVELYVGNAKQSAHFYKTAFGFQSFAYCGLETGNRESCSYVVRQDKIRLVLTTPFNPDSDISDHIRRHGDGVKVIALWVDDARKAYNETIGRGAESVLEPTVYKDAAAGVMPIIFAQAIMFLPLTAAQWATGNAGVQSNLLLALNNPMSLAYNTVFFILIVIFTYVYTALIVNPQQYAEYLKRMNSFIPGIKPGQDTQDYIDTLTTRITLPGANIFIGMIAILPAIAAFAGVNSAFAYFFGGTSLLILVGVRYWIHCSK